jgi:hypothetical protein
MDTRKMIKTAVFAQMKNYNNDEESWRSENQGSTYNKLIPHNQMDVTMINTKK